MPLPWSAVERNKQKREAWLAMINSRQYFTAPATSAYNNKELSEPFSKALVLTHPFFGLPLGQISKIFKNRFWLLNSYKLQHFNSRNIIYWDQIAIEDGILHIRKITRAYWDYDNDKALWFEASIIWLSWLHFWDLLLVFFLNWRWLTFTAKSLTLLRFTIGKVGFSFSARPPHSHCWRPLFWPFWVKNSGQIAGPFLQSLNNQSTSVHHPTSNSARNTGQDFIKRKQSPLPTRDVKNTSVLSMVFNKSHAYTLASGDATNRLRMEEETMSNAYAENEPRLRRRQLWTQIVDIFVEKIALKK